MIDPFRPPEGWYVFGTHVAGSVMLEFSEEEGPDGLPYWERPLTLGAKDEGDTRED